MNEIDTQIPTEYQFTLLEWKQREADFTAMISTKDELLAIQAVKLLEMQTALENALSEPADENALECEKQNRQQMENDLKALQAIAEKSDVDRKNAGEQLATLTE
jgi:elongation factor P--beta-lysine ligase